MNVIILRAIHMRGLHFLESIETYIRNRGKLSPNQMKALNKMNNQYDKKLEKIKKRR